VTATPVRIGIIGGGLMGRELAAALQRWPALVDHPAAPQLTAVCDLNPDALTWFEQLASVQKLTTDYRVLLDDPSIDVLYIAVRHDAHEQIYCDAISAGKDALVEKPFGIDLPAARRIVGCLREHPEVFVRCSSEMPFFPGAQWAYRAAASGALGTIIECSSGFSHSSDVDVNKPLNWKRQRQFCGDAGVMNDLGMHAWHLPLRLGWRPSEVFAELSDIVRERPDGKGGLGPCDTIDNATVLARVRRMPEFDFPLLVTTKRIDPGQKNTWTFDARGMEQSVRFSIANPKAVWRGLIIDGEQAWARIETGSQSVWPTITGGIFEFGFADAILQMWAAFLAERAGELGDRFSCATTEEALATHEMIDAALQSDRERRAIPV
jgi:predicted dehydrogenase